MLAFVIHDAVCSGDTVMFADTVEDWWVRYLERLGEPALFERTGKPDADEDFGEIHRVPYRLHLDRAPATKAELQQLCKAAGGFLYVPHYVRAYTVTPDLTLEFGG